MPAAVERQVQPYLAKLLITANAAKLKSILWSLLNEPRDAVRSSPYESVNLAGSMPFAERQRSV